MTGWCRGTSPSSPLPDPCIEEGGLKARVGAHEQEQVCLLHTSNAAVEQVTRAEVGTVWVEGGTVWVEVGTVWGGGGHCGVEGVSGSK